MMYFWYEDVFEWSWPWLLAKEIEKSRLLNALLIDEYGV